MTKLTDESTAEAFAQLTPDHMLDAIESLGLRCDGRFLALNSYELNAEETNAVFTIESLAAGNISEGELSLWIKKNVQQL